MVFGAMYRHLNSVAAALLLLAVSATGVYPATASAQELRRVTAAGELAVLAKPVVATADARNADVTVVEYFDYNCPYCRRLAPTLKDLLASDGKIRLVYKEWPIFGDVSVYAARNALAAQWQGKYIAAHDALLAGPRLSRNDVVDSTLRNAGIDIGVLKKDLAAHSQQITAMLARNDAEAHALDLDGTPGILVGRSLLPGGADLSFFQKLVAEARSETK